jgi:hypothetical protein
MQVRELPVKKQVVALRALFCGSGFCQAHELEPTFTAALALGIIGIVLIAMPANTGPKYLKLHFLSICYVSFTRIEVATTGPASGFSKCERTIQWIQHISEGNVKPRGGRNNRF